MNNTMKRATALVIANALAVALMIAIIWAFDQPQHGLTWLFALVGANWAALNATAAPVKKVTEEEYREHQRKQAEYNALIKQIDAKRPPY